MQNVCNTQDNKMEGVTIQALSILSVPHSFLDHDDFAVVPTKLDPHCNTIQQIHNGDEKKY